MSENYYVAECSGNRGGRRWKNYPKKPVTKAQLAEYAAQLKDYLLKIEYSKYSSYDSSDDDRVEDSESHWSGVKYCEINVYGDSKHLIVQDDKVIGVLFFLRNNRGETSYYIFKFDKSVQQQITMGYSASHSSNWTYIKKVYLVKRGEGGAPEQGTHVKFEQSEMYPSI